MSASVCTLSTDLGARQILCRRFALCFLGAARVDELLTNPLSVFWSVVLRLLLRRDYVVFRTLVFHQLAVVVDPTLSARRCHRRREKDDDADCADDEKRQTSHLLLPACYICVFEQSWTCDMSKQPCPIPDPLMPFFDHWWQWKSAEEQFFVVFKGRRCICMIKLFSNIARRAMYILQWNLEYKLNYWWLVITSSYLKY